MRLNRNKSILAAFAVIYCIALQACGANTPTKIKTDLLKVSEGLNTAAKTNRALYESGVYGAVGTPSAIKTRQKVATGIYDANEVLIVALDVAKGITAANFGTSKAQILSLLGQSAKAIADAHIGTPQIDLALQAVAAIINDAVVLVSAFTSADIRYVVPVLKTLNFEMVEV